MPGETNREIGPAESVQLSRRGHGGYARSKVLGVSFGPGFDSPHLHQQPDEDHMGTLKDINLLDVGHTITMVGALYAGKGRVLAVLFPEGQDEARKASVEMLDMTVEDWKEFLV